MKALFLTLIAVISLQSQLATAQTLNHSLGSPDGPLRFEENRGQIRPSTSTAVEGKVEYILRGHGMTVYFTRDGVTYQWDRQRLSGLERVSEATGQLIDESFESIHSRTIRMSWIDSNPHVELLGDQPEKEYTNYYLDHCSDGVLGVKKFNKLIYKSIYPGVDVVYYLKDQKLKYDVVFRAGASLSAYQFKYNGSISASINNQQISIRSSYGELTEGKIIATSSNGSEVELHYEMVAEGGFAFTSALGDKITDGLIVDPFVYWSSFFGSTGDEAGTSITANSSGNSFATGYTTSLGSSLAYSGFQGSNNGGYDAYLVKFDAFGNRLWSTYFGGAGTDKSLTSTSDDNGNVWIAGETTSTTLGYLGHQMSYGSGSTDGFAAKFNNAGGRVWATYYGGTGTESIKSIKKDNAGNVLFTGSTTSNNNIAPTGSVQGIDAFIAKLDPSGARLWGFYYGDVGSDDGASIAVDASNNLYLIGTTTSTSNISTNGSSLLGVNSAFVAKFNSAGSRQWGFYFGGSGLEFGTAIALDGTGNLLVGGKTSSTSGIATAGARWPNFYGGTYDGFLAKIDQSLTTIWGTYLVGSGSEEVLSVTADENDNALVLYGAGTSSYVSTFTASGDYLPGAISSYPGDLRLPDLVLGLPGSIQVIDKRILISGTTNSSSVTLTTFPESGFQKSNGGSMDAVFYSYSTYRSMNDNYFTAFGSSGNLTILGNNPGSLAVDALSNLFVTAIDGSGFRLKKYSANGSLVWASSVIGTGGVNGRYIKVDPSGNIYVAGVADYTATGIGSGGHQGQFGGGWLDGILCKFDNNGGLVWSSYYGGSGEDVVFGLAVDGGSIYIVGRTNSPGAISTTGRHQVQLSGSNDGFIAKFSSSGQLSWGSYYGGPGWDGFNRISLTTSGEPLITGSTSSTTGIAYLGYQNSPAGSGDGMLVKFKTDGTSPIWATYYGGAGNDTMDGIDLDASGNIYVGGSTTSTSGIAFGGFQNAFGGGVSDLFMVKFNSSGGILYATYYGGEGDETPGGGAVAPVTVDNNYVFIGGGTGSTTGIASLGIQQVKGSNFNGFLAKFSLVGERQWATYYAGVSEFYDIRPSGSIIYLSGGIIRMPNPTSTGVPEPSNQPSSLVFNGITHNQIIVSYTASISLPDGYLILRKAGSAPTATVVDGAAYLVNQTVGDATVAYIGPSATFTNQGLTNNTTYYYKIYAYNGYGPTSNYNLTSPLAGSAATLTYAIEPTAQPTAFSATSIGLYSMTISYTTATGNPDGYLILRKAGSSPTSNPVDGTAYTIGQSLGDGIVIHTTSGVSIQSTSLNKSTAYYYKIFSFNGSGTARNYLVPAPLTGNATTLTYETQPGSQPTNLVLAPAVSSISVSFNNATVSPLPDGYLIIRSQVGPPSPIPVDGTSYAVPTYLTDSWIISASGTNSILDIDLACETYYYYAVYSFRGSGTEINYLTVSPLSGYTTTDACPPPPCDPCPRVSFGPITISSLWENGEAVIFWENVNASEADALTLQRSLDALEFRSIEPTWKVLSQNSKKATDLEANNLASEVFYYRMRYTSGRSVLYSPSVSLHKLELIPDINVSPNPANDYIQVSGPDIVAYDLLEATGKPLVSRAAPGQLSVKDLSPGLYLVRVYTLQGKPQTVKLILHR